MAAKGFTPTLLNGDVPLPTTPGAYAARVNEEVTALWSRVGGLSGDSYVTPQQYGAVGDGSADDYTAVLAAVTAAIAAGHKTVFFPPGTYDLATQLTITTSGVCLFGLSRHNTVIRRRAGATLTNLVHLGVTSGGTQITGARVFGIGFDGNGSCSDAVLKLRNGTLSDIHNILVTEGTGDGFKTDTATDNINTQTVRNTYFDIIAHNNDANGIRFIGEKDAQYDQLFGRNNGAAAIVFRAFEYDGGTLTETTTCVAGTLLARDNTGDGVVFDGVEKYDVASIVCSGNAGYGIRILSTDNSASGVANNILTVGSASLRNNISGALRAADGANVNGMSFGVVKIVGGGFTNEEGIHLAGVSNVQFGVVLCAGLAGTAIRIKAGTPLGVARESSVVQFGVVRLNSNGSATSTDHHGISIEDSTVEVIIDSLYTANQTTTGTDYEVNLSSTASDIVIGNSSITSSSGSNGVNAPTARQLMFVGRRELEGVELSADHFAFTLSGVLRPSQITGDQNNYNPTGLETASVLFLNSDASRTITGLAGGRDGRVIVVHNDGTNNIILADESGSSTAANRFALTAALTIAADAVALLQYDGTDARWRAVSGGGGSGTIGGSVGTDDNGLGRADGVGGSTLQSSVWTISDAGALSPKTNDGGAVGTTSLGVADLMFASGATVNYNNGALIGTHGTSGTGQAQMSWEGVAAAGSLWRFIAYSSTGAADVFEIGSYRARGTPASPVAVLSGDRIMLLGGRTQLSTTPEDFGGGNVFAIIATAEENHSSTNKGCRFTFEATPIGSATRGEIVRITGSGVQFTGITTTASAANAFLDSGSSPANNLLRSTSSLRYKRDIEDMDPALAEKIVDGARAIWFRSKIKTDRQDWSHYGFIAEELAEIDPRLVQWGYADDAYEVEEITDPDQVIPAEIEKRPVMVPLEVEKYETVKTDGGFVRRRVTHRQATELMPVWDEDGNGIAAVEVPAFEEIEIRPARTTRGETRIVRWLKPGAKLVPDGIAYDRFAVPFLMEIRALKKRVADLESGGGRR